MQEKQTKKYKTHTKKSNKNAGNLFVINWLAINQTITKMLSTLRHVNTNTFATATVTAAATVSDQAATVAEVAETTTTTGLQDLWACNLFL